MHAMAAGTIGHGLRTGVGRKAVERCIEAYKTVRRESELARQAHITVAASASLPNVAAVDWRRRIRGRKDGVFAMTIGADRRLRYPASDGFSVDARLERTGNITVTHTAGLGDGGTERR